MICNVFSYTNNSWKKFDWILLSAWVVLASFGLVSLLSSNKALFSRQLIWVGLALFIIVFGSRVNWSWLIGLPVFRHVIYWLSVSLLLFANLYGSTVRGTTGWLFIGGVQFEPVEFAKFALIIMLAGYFSRRYVEAWTTRHLFFSLLLALIPAGLAAIHPDAGSATILLSIWLGILLMSGINVKRFLMSLVLAVVALVLVWSFMLRPYQKDRIRGFISPDYDPLGVNYNVIQSKIAIGSAGWLGKGFGAGTQTQLKYLPEAQTDFIFAAFVEEWGVIGGLILVGLYVLVVYRIALIGKMARNNGMKFVVLGVGLFCTIQFIVNIGSNIGLLPVTGITLPFVSYGGSSVLTTGLLLSIVEYIRIDSSK